MNASDAAYFKAYNQLTIVPWVTQMYGHGGVDKAESLNTHKAEIGFSEFKEAVEKNKVVNSNKARDISKFHNQFLQDQMRFSSNSPYFNMQVGDIVKKAFNLGLVGNNETLIAKYEKSI